MKYLLAILFFWICCSQITDAIAQDADWIRYRVVDQKTKNPIPFASVQIKSRRTGVVTNADGDFQIPVRYSVYGDTLMISCIGYDTKISPMRGLNPQALQTILLVQSSTVLSAVEVKGGKSGRLTAYKVVKAAIHNLPYNAISDPYSYDAYYRDYQFEDSIYVNLNEALLQVIDSGFASNDQLKTRIALLDYIPNETFKRDSTSEIAYDNREKKFIPNAKVGTFGGNELMILRIHDPLRNSNQFSFSFVNVFNKDFLTNHYFSFGNPTTRDGVELFNIKIESKYTAAGASHNAVGNLYIEKGNFAFHKMEYRVYETEKEKKILLYDIAVEYSRKEKYMHPNYISFSNLFKMKNPQDFIDTAVYVDTDADAFVVYTNHRVDDRTANDSSHFELRANGRRLLIKDVKVVDQNQIYLFLDKNPGFNIHVSAKTMTAMMKFKFKGVKDYDGRELNVPSYITVNQFREVFIQQTGLPVEYNKFNYMNPLIPLSEQIPVGSESNSNRWMNTPLKKKGSNSVE
ncbi:MAG: carboxypeptidase-like regulatory domain-containing protein [Chryseolinea sp.]